MTVPDSLGSDVKFVTARLPLFGSTEHPSGVPGPPPCKVAIGFVPPCAYSTMRLLPPSAMNTSPLRSAHTPAGSLKPVSVPTCFTPGYDSTPTASAPMSETYSSGPAAAGDIHDFSLFGWHAMARGLGSHAGVQSVSPAAARKAAGCNAAGVLCNTPALQPASMPALTTRVH